jgi:hypothetical protein
MDLSSSISVDLEKYLGVKHVTLMVQDVLKIAMMD